MFVRTIGLIAFISLCGSLGVPSLFGGQQPNAALSKVEIVDVDNGFASRSGHKDDHSLLNLEARNLEDARFIGRLWKVYGPVFGFQNWNNFGPDSSYRQIRLTHKGKVLTLNSWHPLFEKNPGLVVTSHGVTPLNGRSKAEVLKADNPDYVARRSAFDALVDQCLAHNKALQRTPATQRRR